jgi:hypothetical protein
MNWRAIGNAPGLMGPPDEPEWLAGLWLDDMDDAEAADLASCILKELPSHSAHDCAEALRAAYRAGDDRIVVTYIDRKYQSHLDGLNDY